MGEIGKEVLLKVAYLGALLIPLRTNIPIPPTSLPVSEPKVLHPEPDVIKTTKVIPFLWTQNIDRHVSASLLRTNEIY